MQEIEIRYTCYKVNILLLVNNLFILFYNIYLFIFTSISDVFNSTIYCTGGNGNQLYLFTFRWNVFDVKCENLYCCLYLTSKSNTIFTQISIILTSCQTDETSRDLRLLTRPSTTLEHKHGSNQYFKQNLATTNNN